MNENHIITVREEIGNPEENSPTLLKLSVKTQRNFDKKIDKSGGPEACWIWTAGKVGNGYGRFAYTRKELWLAHRISYAISKGPIPGGMNVLHSCDNPPYCNPAHLWLGTQLDNNLDKIKKGRDNPAIGDRNGSRTKPHLLVRGSQNSNSVLSEEQVVEIRRIHAEGKLNYLQIAPIFGVSKEAIGSIIRGKTWKRVK